MPLLLSSGGDNLRFARGLAKCGDTDMPSVYVNPREPSTCTAHLYIHLPNDRSLAPPSPRHRSGCYEALPLTFGLLRPTE